MDTLLSHGPLLDTRRAGPGLVGQRCVSSHPFGDATPVAGPHTLHEDTDRPLFDPQTSGVDGYPNNELWGSTDVTN